MIQRFGGDLNTHHVLDHAAPGYLDEVVELTGGQGVDFILEMLANANLQKDFGAPAMGGRIAVIDNRGSIEINARFAMNKNAAILGVALFHARPAQGIHSALVEGLGNGTPQPVIQQELPLAQASRAHEAGDGERPPRQNRAGAVRPRTARPSHHVVLTVSLSVL